MGIVSEPTIFERIHQFATIHVEFFFCGNVGVVFVRQLVHLTDSLLQYDPIPAWFF